jgi:hypothetical protein
LYQLIIILSFGGFGLTDITSLSYYCRSFRYFILMSLPPVTAIVYRLKRLQPRELIGGKE